MDEVFRYIARLFTESPFYYLSWPAAAMIVGTLIGIASPKAAARLSIVPRTSDGLVGIITAPFIHFSITHLAANLPPFLILGTLVLLRADSPFPWVSLAIAAAQGALLWCLGRKAAHAGMSGVIFGYFGYLLAIAWLSQSASDLLVAGVVILFYGGMLLALAPARNGTSWEGHLFGLIAGVGVAWLHHSNIV